MSEQAERRRYEAAEAKQFGNLHQRMKYLIAAAQKAGHHNLGNEVWHAIWDLETEVSHHVPAEPPYGRRH